MNQNRLKHLPNNIYKLNTSQISLFCKPSVKYVSLNDYSIFTKFFYLFWDYFYQFPIYGDYCYHTEPR